MRFKNDNKALTGSKSSNLYKRAVLLEVSIQSLSKSGKLGTDYVSLKNETENLREGLVQLEEEFARLSSELINLNSELEANGLKKIRRTSSPTFYKQTIRFTKGVLNNTPSRVKNKKKVYKNFYISNIFLYITDNIRFFFIEFHDCFFATLCGIVMRAYTVLDLYLRVFVYIYFFFFHKNKLLCSLVFL